MGITYNIANDGKQAVELFKTNEFDLVLMDLQMPVMDGLEATRRIRSKIGPNQKTPIIAFTARVASNILEECLKAGCSDYLAKPVKAIKLYEKLLKILQNKAQQP